MIINITKRNLFRKGC